MGVPSFPLILGIVRVFLKRGSYEVKLLNCPFKAAANNTTLSPLASISCNAHVDHHGPLGVVRSHQRGQVAAVHLLDVPQVRLAVVRHHFGALLVDVQPTVWQRTKERHICVAVLTSKVSESALLLSCFQLFTASGNIRYNFCLILKVLWLET